MSDEMELAAVGAEEYFSEPDETPADAPAEDAPAPTAEPTVDITAREAELKKREAELNKWNMRIAEREKALAATPAAPKADGEPALPPLSEDAEKMLDDFIQRKLGSKLNVIDTLFEDTIESELESFAASKGVDADTLRATLAETGIQPREFSRKGFKEAFSAAYDIHKSRTFDLEAEKAKWKDEIMAELKSQGIRPDSVEPSSRVDLDAEPSSLMDDSEVSPSDKYAAILKKLQRG